MLAEDECGEIPGVQVLASKTTSPRKTARVFMLMNPLIPVVEDAHKRHHERGADHEGGDSGSLSCTCMLEERRNFKRLRECFVFDPHPSGAQLESSGRAPSVAKSPRLDNRMPVTEPSSGLETHYRPAAIYDFSDSVAEANRLLGEGPTDSGLRHRMHHPLESENSSGPHVLEKLSRVTEEDDDDEDQEREEDSRRWGGEREDPFHQDRETPFSIPWPDGPTEVRQKFSRKGGGGGYEGNSGLAHRQEPSSGDDLSGPIPSVVGCRGIWMGSVARSTRMQQTDDETCVIDGEEDVGYRKENSSREVRWSSTMSWLNRMADQQESLMTDWDSLETKIRQFQLAMTDLYQCKTQLYFKLESVSMLIQSSLKALKTFADVETQRSKEEHLLYAPGSETTFSSAPCVTYNSDVSYDQSHPFSTFEYCESPRLGMARFATAHSHSDVLPETFYPKGAYFLETNQPPTSTDDHTTAYTTKEHFVKRNRTSSSAVAAQSCRCGMNTVSHSSSIPPNGQKDCRETLLTCHCPAAGTKMFASTTGEEGVFRSSRSWSDCSQSSSSSSSFRQESVNLENFPLSLCNERLYNDRSTKAEVYPKYLHSFSQLAATGFGDLPPVCAPANLDNNLG